MGCRKLTYYTETEPKINTLSEELTTKISVQTLRSSYLFGFNGKEKDDEVKGAGAQYDYGFRIYDSRLGKFLSVDPLEKKFPWYTPYQFAGNGPIVYVDLDGKEPKWFMELLQLIGYTPVICQQHSNDVEEEAEYQQDLAMKREAFGEVKKDVEKLYEGQKTVVCFIPGMSSIYALFEKKYGEAGAFAIIDLFGGEATKAGFAFVLPVMSKTLKASFKGKGANILRGIVGKTENIATHLTEKDVLGAIKDIFGTPVVINNKSYQHLKEVKDALRGMKKQINKLNKGIASGTMTDDVLLEALRVRRGLQKEVDRIQNVLTKAENANKKIKKGK